MILFTHSFLKARTKNHVEYSSILTRPRLYSTLYLFLPLAPMPLPKPLRFFTVLCVAARAKVTCLAIDCILLHWFPYEIGSSTPLWQHGWVQRFMLPAAVFSTFLHTHSVSAEGRAKTRRHWWKLEDIFQAPHVTRKRCFSGSGQVFS